MQDKLILTVEVIRDILGGLCNRPTYLVSFVITMVIASFAYQERKLKKVFKAILFALFITVFLFGAYFALGYIINGTAGGVS